MKTGIWILMLLAGYVDAADLTLRVKPQADDAAAVVPGTARLWMSWWGRTEVIDLQTRYQGSDLLVSVPLNDDTWRRLDAPYAPDFARLYFEFEGFAPVSSAEFGWRDMESGTTVDGEPTDFRSLPQFTIGFPGTEPTTFAFDAQHELVLPLRRPLQKQLRFVDDSGAPVTDITVSGGMFVSRNNHCAIVSGYEPYFRDRAVDADGRLLVPDADVDYVFDIRLPPYSIIAEPAPDYYGNAFNTTLNSDEFTVRIHRYAKVPLSLRLKQDNKPAAGVQVLASVRASCGAGVGLLGVTDDMGVLQIEEFYPEYFDAVCIVKADGTLLWSTAPPTEAVTFELPRGMTTGELGACYRSRGQ